MTKQRAIHSFFSSFNVPAYDETSVPDNAAFPYITYSIATGGLNDVVSLSASAWYRGSSWIPVDEKEAEISDRLPCVVSFDDGAIFITKGTPFAYRMGDEQDDQVKRYVFNINVNYIGKD